MIPYIEAFLIIFYNCFMLNEQKINELFKYSYTKRNKNHDEALDVFDEFSKILGRKIPILVNFDTHSDIYINFKTNLKNIATWVNYCVLNLGVKEFYWVIPEYIAENPNYRELYENKKNIVINAPFIGFDDTDIDLDIVNVKSVYYDKNNKEIISPAKTNHINKRCKEFNLKPIIYECCDFEKITITILTIKNISILKDKEFLLSVDSDYFYNSGFDTLEYINNRNISSQELVESFNHFITKMHEAQLKPICTSLTESPIYFSSKLKNELDKFYLRICQASHFQLQP